MVGISKAEKKVLEQAGRIVRPLEVIGILDIKKNQANVLLHRMRKKNLLVKVEKGVYVNPDKVGNTYVLLPLVLGDYYISYFTALNYHGLTTQVPAAIFIVNLKKRKEIQYKNDIINLIKIRKRDFFGFEKVELGNTKMNMAVKEKALLDSLDRSDYAGGIKHVISCFKNFSSEKLAKFVLKSAKKTNIRRAGAIMDKKHITIPAKLEKKMLESCDISYYTKLNKTGQNKGYRIKKWKVLWNAE